MSWQWDHLARNIDTPPDEPVKAPKRRLGEIGIVLLAAAILAAIVTVAYLTGGSK